MSNKLMGMYLMASLLMACGATHDVGDQFRQEQQDDAGQVPDDAGQQVTPTEDAGLTGSCLNNGDCDPVTQVCDVGVCRTGCGPNYPNNTCAQGEACDDYICRPTCTAGCPTGTVCDQQTNFCVSGSCSAQNPCPAQYGCDNGTCVPTGTACSAQLPCGQDEVCIAGVCHLWCGPNYPNNICPGSQQCQPNDYCG
jgi:hypothetical protein